MFASINPKPNFKNNNLNYENYESLYKTKKMRRQEILQQRSPSH